MLNSDGKVTFESSERLMSDEDDSNIGSRISKSLLNDGVDGTYSASQATNIDGDCLTSDGSESPSSSASRRSIRSVSSCKSSQLTRIKEKNSPSNSSGIRLSSPTSSIKSRCTSSRRLTSESSSSSENDENDKTVLPSQRSPQSEGLQSPHSSLSSQSSPTRSQSTRFQTLFNSSRKSLTSDSDEDIVPLRKPKSVKLFDSDVDESDADAANESPKKILTNEEIESGLEEPEIRISTKKKRKKRLVLSSDNSGSDSEKDTISLTIQNTLCETNRDNESEFSNLTVKEKRRRKLEELNEQKRCDFVSTTNSF